MEPKRRHLPFIISLIGAAILLVSACRQQEEVAIPSPVPPTPTSEMQPTESATAVAADDFVTIATDAPFPPFATFDDFGRVVGFDAALAESIMERTGYDYEFVVTNYEGMLESVAQGEFDMALAALAEPEPVPGVVFSDPYLEVGQVLVVLANEREVVSHSTLPSNALVGVVTNSLASELTALRRVPVAETSLRYFESPGAALQGLIDGEVRGVIMDHDDAEHYTRTYFEQLKMAGGAGEEAWISAQSYVVAVNEEKSELLQAVNGAIAAAREDGTIERITRTWLVSEESIDAGESLIGTPDNVIVIGVVGQLESVDPASAPDLIGWEIKRNTMSGLFTFDADDDLVPALAEGMPEISEDGLEYTFTLRPDLTFPDGTPLTAEDVQFSLNRAALLGNWHVNAFLKDGDGDAIADADAVQVVDQRTVRIVLQEPASYFLSLLATPPYFVVSKSCYESNADAALTCNGIGRYEIVEWEPNVLLQLQVNPQWSGERQPAFDNIQIRFYDDVERLRQAVELEAVDMAWVGLPTETAEALEDIASVRSWEGPSTFKSYLVFRHDDSPWQNPALRQAVAFAVDREALAQNVFGGRRAPLYSPLPNSVPEQVESEPRRDLGRAQELLRLAGYSVDNRLVITLWYLSDGRYTPLEEQYALALKQQLEETGMMEVELQSAPWSVYGVQMAECNYSAFLLGWPPVGWPTRYPAAMGWLEYFVTNTDSLCSNYQSAEMDALLAEVRGLDPTDVEGQQALYTEIQELWSEEYPTLDLTQESPEALAWESIDNVTFDRMGLLRYETLTKTSEE